MRQIAAERQDEWGMYLLERLAVSNRRHRGAGAVWRFMLAVQGDDRDAKRNAFYGANKIEGLHPLIMEIGDSQDVEVSANELKKWIDQAVGDHGGANLIAIVERLNEPSGGEGPVFEWVKTTLRDRLRQHLATEQFVRSVLAEGADIAGAIKGLSEAGVFNEGAELESLLLQAVEKLDDESFAALRARVQQREAGDVPPEQARWVLAGDLQAWLMPR